MPSDILDRKMFSLLTDDNLRELMTQILTCDASEVVDIIQRTGEKWFVEIVFKNHKRLFIGNFIPEHHAEELKKADKVFLDHVPSQFKVFWSVFTDYT